MNHSDVAHQWAHQLRESMNYQNHSMHFYGPTIYSYGSHFPIATMYPDLGVILYTSRDYSVSTAKHKGHVSSAIDRTKWEVLVVNSVEDVKAGKAGKYSHQKNIHAIIEEIYTLMDKQTRSKAFNYMGDVKDLIKTLDRYIELFKCKTVARDMIKKKHPEMYSHQKEILGRLLNDREEFTDEIDQMYDEAEASRIAWDEKKREQYQAKRKREAEREREKLAKWKRGEYNGTLFYRHNGSDLLRMKNDMVETSKGIKIEPKEAKRLWHLVEAVIESGEDREFKSGIVRVNAHYSVNSIKANGDLQAGCHFLSGEVIKEFVEAQGWAEELVY